MCDQILHGRQDLGDARLVVRAQQRRAVRHDQVLTYVIFQEIERAFLDGYFFVQRDVAAFVVDGPGSDIGPGCAVGSVHVGDEPDDGQVFTALACGKPAVHVAVFIHVSPFQAHFLHLFGNIFAQLQLFGGRRTGLAGLVGRGLERNIF